MSFDVLAHCKLKTKIVEGGIAYYTKVSKFIERPYPHGRKLVTFRVQVIDRGIADRFQLTVVERASTAEQVLTADPEMRSLFAGIVAAELAIRKRLKELAEVPANGNQDQ